MAEEAFVLVAKKKDKYMFMGTGDAVLYFLISCVYPVLSYGFQIQALAQESTKSIHELMITGLFFCAVYFYDFYNRFAGSGTKTIAIVNILLGATVLFACVSFAIIVDVLIVFLKEAYLAQNKVIFSLIPLLALFPSIFAIVELIRRGAKSRKEKITAAGV